MPKYILIPLSLGLSFFLVYTFFTFPNKSNLPIKETVEDFTLADQQGALYQLSSYAGKKGIVLTSYGIGCPIARFSVITLKQLRDQYEKDGIAFLLIDPVMQDKKDDIIDESKDFGIDIPILIDDSGVIAKSLKMVRTAETILIDPKNWTIVYRGPVDDHLDYEVQREKAKNHYLKWAMESLLKRRSVKISKVEVKGCLLNLDWHLSKVSYPDDIVPILEKRCLECHNARGATTFIVNNYEALYAHAEGIKKVIRTKHRPIQWNDMTATEIKTLTQWLESGMPKGREVNR